MAAATKLYLFWAGTTGNVPAGWSYESGFDDKFIRGSNTYGGTGGSDTHTHIVSGAVCNPTGDTSLGTATGINIADPVHIHSLAGLTCSHSTSLPLYRALIVISIAVATTTIPASVIAIFESAPGSGFTAYTDANSRYVRGGSAVANGGAATHTHNYIGTTGNNDLSSDVFPFLVPKAAHTHTHSVNIPSTTGSYLPPGVKVLLYSSDSGQTMPVGLVAFFNGTPPAATWDVVSGAATDYYERLLYADTSHGTTGASHGHSITGPTALTGIPSAISNIDDSLAGAGTTGDAHTHVVSCTFDTFDPLPGYINVVFGKFKGIEGLEPPDGWSYYKQIDIADAGAVSADYQMMLTIHKGDGDDNTVNGIIYCDNLCLDFHDDIRFGTTNDPATAIQLKQWVESSDANTAVIWIKCPTDGSNTFYMFIGRATTDEFSDGDATFIFFDDFEETVGQPASKWKEATTLLNGKISDDQAVQGTRCVKHGHEVDTNSSFAIEGGISNPGDIRILLWHYPTSTDRHTTYAGMEESDIAEGVTVGGRVTFYSNGDIKVYDGAWVDTGIDYTADSWYRVEMQMNDADDQFNLSINNVNSSNNPHGYRYNITSTENVYITTPYTYPTGYTDCVCVMKFSSTAEPTWSSFGAWTSLVEVRVPKPTVAVGNPLIF